MKKVITFLSVIILFTACSKKEVTIPENILKQKEMTAVLTDIHIAQAAIGNKLYNDSSNYKMNDYLAYILKQHKIEREVFLMSLKFYSANPEILHEVYDSVITTLSKTQGEAEKDQ